jgi:predicted DNA-binding protein
MKVKTVTIEIDLPYDAQKQLENLAHDREYTVEHYLAECIHSKIHDMISAPVTVGFKPIRESK